MNVRHTLVDFFDMVMTDKLLDRYKANFYQLTFGREKMDFKIKSLQK